MKATLQDKSTSLDGVLYIAMELHHKMWEPGFGNARRFRLVAQDIENRVLDSASIEVSRHQRKVERSTASTSVQVVCEIYASSRDADDGSQVPESNSMATVS